eukprot:TRINITY_DN4606_c0_g2_i1.p1 TRINITY_DN4606_c0_g2~~TRINITY_DN4606_c0_g2_i1.p1  ORF type:complete len:473 (+),score=113.77 TRINITY_DN4606_c0_g2_i1:132-1550(+)
MSNNATQYLQQYLQTKQANYLIPNAQNCSCNLLQQQQQSIQETTCQFCKQKENIINQTLIQEREAIRIKHAELEQEYQKDLQMVKQSIFQECELTLERELRDQQLLYENQLNMKFAEVSSLNTKINERNIRLDQSEKEKTELNQQIRTLNDQIATLKQKNSDQKTKFQQEIEKLKQQHDAELADRLSKLENQLTMKHKAELMKVQQENDILKVKISEFDAKMKQVSELLADIEKFKVLVNKKNTEIVELKQNISQLTVSNDQLNVQLKQKGVVEEELRHQITDYSSRVEKLKLKASENKSSEPIIKTEYITIEKPVEVEKVVEVIKYVPVEKLIREKCPPKQPIIIQECVTENVVNEQQLLKIEKKKNKIILLKGQITQLEQKIEELVQIINSLQSKESGYISEVNTQQISIGNLQKYIKELEGLLMSKTNDFSQLLIQKKVAGNEQRVVVQVSDPNNVQEKKVLFDKTFKQ